MRLFLLSLAMLFLSMSVEASAFNILYFKNASSLDVYTLLQLKSIGPVEGLHLLNADDMTSAQLCALRELNLKELGLGVSFLNSDFKRTIKAMTNLKKLDLPNLTEIKDTDLSMFTGAMLAELDIRNVAEISDAFMNVLKNSKIKHLNIAGVKEITQELLMTLSQMRLTELNIGELSKLNPEAITELKKMKSIKTLKFGVVEDLKPQERSILKDLFSNER